MSRPKIMSGAEVACFINGKRIGQVSSFRFTSVPSKRAIYALDSGQPYELAPTQTKVTGTLSLWRVIGDGGAEGNGLAAFFEDLPRERYFSILLTERGSDTVFFKADQCTMQEQTWEVQTKALVTGTITFEGLTWENEVKGFSI